MPKRKCSDVDQTFGRNLAQYRKACGFTQEQVANLINLNRSTYTKYETCTSEPSIEILKRIISVLGVDANAVLGYDEVETVFSDNKTPLNRLTYDEGMLIGAYRAFSEEDKQRVTSYVQSILKEAGEKYNK